MYFTLGPASAESKIRTDIANNEGTNIYISISIRKQALEALILP